jgi:hypothetical protein
MYVEDVHGVQEIADSVVLEGKYTVAELQLDNAIDGEKYVPQQRIVRLLGVVGLVQGRVSVRRLKDAVVSQWTVLSFCEMTFPCGRCDRNNSRRLSGPKLTFVGCFWYCPRPERAQG